MQHWLGVVSKNHVLRAKQLGFAQVCHGKKAPLMRMKKGDLLIYYSPKIEMGGTEMCQQFTAIGKVKEGIVYQVEMSPTFHPYRIDIEYFPSKEIFLEDLKQELDLTQKSGWGMALRRGLLPLSAKDGLLIAKSMGISL